MNKQKVFYIIYDRTKTKHPEWSNRRVRATTLWILKKNKRYIEDTKLLKSEVILCLKM